MVRRRLTDSTKKKGPPVSDASAPTPPKGRPGLRRQTPRDTQVGIPRVGSAGTPPKARAPPGMRSQTPGGSRSATPASRGRATPSGRRSTPSGRRPRWAGDAKRPESKPEGTATRIGRWLASLVTRKKKTEEVPVQAGALEMGREPRHRKRGTPPPVIVVKKTKRQKIEEAVKAYRAYLGLVPSGKGIAVVDTRKRHKGIVHLTVEEDKIEARSELGEVLAGLVGEKQFHEKAFWHVINIPEFREISRYGAIEYDAQKRRGLVHIAHYEQATRIHRDMVEPHKSFLRLSVAKTNRHPANKDIREAITRVYNPVTLDELYAAEHGARAIDLAKVGQELSIATIDTPARYWKDVVDDKGRVIHAKGELRLDPKGKPFLERVVAVREVPSSVYDKAPEEDRVGTTVLEMEGKGLKKPMIDAFERLGVHQVILVTSSGMKIRKRPSSDPRRRGQLEDAVLSVTEERDNLRFKPEGEEPDLQLDDGKTRQLGLWDKQRNK